jgi:hypothetical protein
MLVFKNEFGLILRRSARAGPPCQRNCKCVVKSDKVVCAEAMLVMAGIMYHQPVDDAGLNRPMCV